MQEGTGDAKRAEELHQEGYAHYREGRRAEALESFRQALAHDPRRVLTRVDVGEILRQQGRGDEALVHLRMAIEMEGEPTRLSAQAYNIAGNVLSERGSFLESLEEYDSSIRIDPIFAPAYVNRGWALYKLERMEEAEADFRKVLELEAGNFKALKCLGLLCLSNGRPGEAREILDLAACIQPGDPDVLNNLGLALLKSGRLQAAGESFQKALNMEPGHFDTLFNVGRFLEKSGRSEEARLHFGSLLEAFPQWKDLLMMEMARLIGKERKGNDDHA
jgi:tetratricopeptide (TPR) repeat protein